MNRNHRNTARSLVLGTLAGAAATWVMGQLTTQLYDKEAKPAREREDRARGGQTAYGVAAKKLASLAGRELPKPKQERYGSLIHWLLGVGTGALYARLRPRLDAPGILRALAFGGAFWLVADEIMVPLLGLTPGPTAFPWQTHARGLAGHLAYGTATEAALELLQPA